MNVTASYTVAPARYARGMMAVHCPSADGYKTEAAWLAEYHSTGRYSGRENAYIMPAERARQFEVLFKAGYTMRNWGGGWMLKDPNEKAIRVNGPEHKAAKAKLGTSDESVPTVSHGNR